MPWGRAGSVFFRFPVPLHIFAKFPIPLWHICLRISEPVSLQKSIGADPGCRLLQNRDRPSVRFLRSFPYGADDEKIQRTRQHMTEGSSFFRDHASNLCSVSKKSLLPLEAGIILFLFSQIQSRDQYTRSDDKHRTDDRSDRKRLVEHSHTQKDAGDGLQCT